MIGMALLNAVLAQDISVNAGGADTDFAQGVVGVY